MLKDLADIAGAVIGFWIGIWFLKKLAVGIAFVIAIVGAPMLLF